MKKAGLMGIILLLIGVITFYLLLHKPSDHENLLKFKGQVVVLNYSKGYMDWATGPGLQDAMGAIPLQENDLIGFLGRERENGEYLLMVQQKTVKDKTLTVTMDSLGLYVDNRLISLVLYDNEKAFLKWIHNSEKEDIRHLQSVILADNITDNVLTGIKEIGQFTSGIGLSIQCKSVHNAELLQFLNPAWLWLHDIPMDSLLRNELYKTKNLESLVFMDVDINQLDFSRLVHLQSLQLNVPDTIDAAQFKQLPKSLTTLQISVSDIKDLSFVEKMPQLQELIITHCDSLKDISSLKLLPHLKVLSLADCDTITDLSALTSLKELTWFSPPSGITENQLASIVRNSPGIETLILVNSHHLKSLNNLKHLNKLTSLAIPGTPLEPDSLIRFQQLKYLAYGNNSDDDKQRARDSITILTLKKAMPHTMVTAAEPFCLSTGWLIVFFALLILFTVMAVKIKSKVSAS